jgi:hypothetical protein
VALGWVHLQKSREIRDSQRAASDCQGSLIVHSEVVVDSPAANILYRYDLMLVPLSHPARTELKCLDSHMSKGASNSGCPT